MTLYRNRHVSQFDATATPITRCCGCSWVSARNGVDAQSGGGVDLTPDDIHRLVPNDQESNPTTPGWSLADVDRAMRRIAVPFDVRSGRGWPAVLAALQGGLYVVLQGDSEVFGNQTCSGKFDGDHAIGVHPDHRVNGADVEWWTNDPICPKGRWVRESKLRDYAKALAPGVLFGVFTTPVPVAVPDTGTGAAVQSFKVPEARTFVTLPKGAKLYDNSALAANADTVVLDPGRELVKVGDFSDAIAIVAYEPRGTDPGARSLAMFVKRSQITEQRVERPRTAADVRAARNEGYNEGRGDVIAAGQGVPKK